MNLSLSTEQQGNLQFMYVLGHWNGDPNLSAMSRSKYHSRQWSHEKNWSEAGYLYALLDIHKNLSQKAWYNPSKNTSFKKWQKLELLGPITVIWKRNCLFLTRKRTLSCMHILQTNRIIAKQKKKINFHNLRLCST